MNRKTRSYMVWLVVIITITLACACPGIPNELLQAQDNIETAQAIITEIPVDEMMQTAQALATEMPIEDMLGTVEGLASEMPVSPEDLLQTASAGGLPLPGTGNENKDLPQDIPIVGERNDDLFSSKGLVNYTTSLDLNTVLDFYQSEMPTNGWQPTENEPIINPQTSVLYFEKPQRTAMITINNTDGETGVTIVIESK